MHNIPLFMDVYKLDDDKINIYKLHIADKEYYSFSKMENDYTTIIIIARLFNIEFKELLSVIISCNGFVSENGIYLFNKYDDANAAATILTLMRRK